ncbi:MAG: hypothetical protein HY619_05710 [Thaumarchaeota archaeon]|nr:hypothetical protein [Nitrososphaerota archaeon]
MFDKIFTFVSGDLVLLLDDNFSESARFIDAIFSKRGFQNVAELAYLKPRCAAATVLKLTETNPTHLSIEVNKYRSSHPGWIMVHSYLPDILVANPKEAENILKIFHTWIKSSAERENLDFMILPRRTFKTVEMRLKAIVSGVIEFYSDDGEAYMIPIKACESQFHLKRIPYRLEDRRLLIKLNNEFADRLVIRSRAELEERARYLAQNQASLMIVPGPEQLPRSTPVEEKILLSQSIGRSMAEIVLLFPENPDMLENVIQWHLDGYVDLSWCQPTMRETRKESMSFLTKLFLRLPTRLSSILISRVGLLGTRIPVAALMTRVKASENFAQILSQDLSTNHRIKQAEEYLQDIATRNMTYRIIQRLGEDPRQNLELKHLPKIIRLLLKLGYGTDSFIVQVTPRIYEVRVKKCPLCRGLRSATPQCQPLVGAIKGTVVVCFKKGFDCHEKECAATGARACTFQIELNTEAPDWTSRGYRHLSEQELQVEAQPRLGHTDPR